MIARMPHGRVPASKAKAHRVFTIAPAAPGMIDLIRKGHFKKDETVLFWHTGGRPTLFAEKYINGI